MTVAVPLTESSTLVAVTVIEAAAVTLDAVSTPAVEIVPADADQFTAVLKLPVPMTATVQGSDAPEASGVAQLGTTEETLEAGVGCGFGFSVAVMPPPQPAARTVNSKASLVVLILKIFLLVAVYLESRSFPEIYRD